MIRVRNKKSLIREVYEDLRTCASVALIFLCGAIYIFGNIILAEWLRYG